MCANACTTTNTAEQNAKRAEQALSSVLKEISDAPVAKPEPLETKKPPSVAISAKNEDANHKEDLLSAPKNKPNNDVLLSAEPEDITTPSNEFSNLSFWKTSDPTPALKAFKRSCALWKRKPDEDWLKPGLKMFGQFKDWRPACIASLKIEANQTNAVQFFQRYFEPVSIGQDTGLLTAYYAPELPVRRVASLEYSEPILAKPSDPQIQRLARKDISVTTSTVLGYGRPIDVFFLQIQGSGQIKFPDGTTYRAAFDGHNGRPYTSIGRLLIKRGVLDKDRAGKRDIENWMVNAGYLKTKELMAENARYIFFKTERYKPTEGPKGAMGIPLTDMGSLAVDSNYFPYGVVIWVETKFPSKPGDYSGKKAGRLLVAQDTGGAIKGKKRGDVFFGSGDAAGAIAGIMKHQATWTLFLPVGLALKPASLS